MYYEPDTDEDVFFYLNAQCFSACINNDWEYLLKNKDIIPELSFMECMVTIITSHHSDFSSWDIIFPLLSKQERCYEVLHDKTLLMYCCELNNDPLKKQKIERLLKSGCSSLGSDSSSNSRFKTFEYNGKSALSYLVQSNDVELIKWFISEGLELELELGTIKPSILFDMFSPSNDAANIIYDYDINEYEERMLELNADYDPFPPLSFKNKDTVSFMLSLFRDKYQKDLIRTIKNDFGDTLLCVACSEGDKEKIKLVVKHGGDPSTVPEINFNSHLLLEEVMEEIRKEEKIKWFLILQNIDKIQTNQNLDLDLLESDDPSVQLVYQLGGMHNDTLLRMIMPFM
jgi:hypothetical protein